MCRKGTAYDARCSRTLVHSLHRSIAPLRNASIVNSRRTLSRAAPLRYPLPGITYEAVVDVAVALPTIAALVSTVSDFDVLSGGEYPEEELDMKVRVVV